MTRIKFNWFFFLTAIFFLVFSARGISAHTYPFVIRITEDAYEPSEITVDTNSTVIFINQDSIDRWPASNIHPTHEEYSEFDPKKPLKPGETWAFNPKREGTWKYHDHLSPHVRGTLTVVKSTNTLISFWEGDFWKSVKASFLSLFQRVASKKIAGQEFKTLSSVKQIESLKNLAESENADKVWTFLSETYNEEEGSEGNVHDLAHLAGTLIFEQQGISGITTCSPTFAFGCYHGLLDAAFANSLDGLPEAEKGCEQVGAINSGPYASCIHGIGHGIASFYQVRDLEKSLDSCEKLSNGRSFCNDGVFMEFVRGAPASFYQSRDPFFPCSNLEKERGSLYSEACGRNQPNVFMQKLGLKLDESITLCGQNSLSTTFKDACFSALGFIFARTQNPQGIIDNCRKITNQNYQFTCMKSAAGELIFQNVKGWQEKSKLVCDSLTGQFLGLCHTNLQRLIQEYGR